MKNMKLKSLPEMIRAFERGAGRYTVVFFVLLLAVVYGFVLYRVATLSSAQPSDSDVAAQVKASAVPHIDPNVVKDIQDLQDNSVNVQTLFNQARDNPFQE